MKDSRFKLMVLVLAAGIIALGTAAISRAAFTGRILISQALSRVEYDSSLAASRINGWLESQISYLSGAAEDLGWILESGRTGELRAIIESHYQNYEKSYFQMYVGYPDGTLWFPGRWEVPAGWRADKRAWYIGAVRDPLRVFISDPYPDARSGRTCIAISKAILKDGEILAVMGVDIYLDSIRELVNENPIAGGRGVTFLVNVKSGIILFQPGPLAAPGEDGAYRNIYDGFGGAYRELINAGDGESIFITGYDGIRRYCNGRTIPAAGWKLFSLVEQDSIQGPIKRQTWFEIGLSVTVLLLIVVLLIVTSQAMRRAAMTAKEHSDMKTAFLANMSHEIRTPMNSVIGFAELALENPGLGEETRDYLQKIRNSAKDLLGVLNDILDVSKIEAGKLVLEKIPFDLHNIIAACESAAGVKAAEKGISLYVYSEPFIEYKLLGDPTKLRQVLLNLLANAVKFTNAGTVKLIVTAEPSAAGRILIRFEVKDSGIGMSAAQMENIFRPFEQADGSTTRKYGGTGLGLSISKNLVELMGGELSVESAPGIGSKFSFSLEFELSGKKNESREAEAGPPGEARRPVFSGRILVCEDNALNQELIRDHLERLGLETDIAENGKLGLEAVRQSAEEGRPYDLIFMDIHMPVMDGLEASSEIRRLGCASPIVALTANVLTQDTGVYHRYGIAGCLGKPFTTRELWDCLEKYLGPPVSDSSPAIDYQAGLSMAGDNEELYEKLRRLFYDQHRNFFEEFLSLLEKKPEGHTGDQKDDTITTAHRMVHSLKSGAALIGAEKLRASAAGMEASLKGGANYNREQLEALRGALEAVLGELEGERGSTVQQADPPG